MSFSDFKNLVKLRLTLLVVFSASISFLIGSKIDNEAHGYTGWSHINWMNWVMLIVGGFLVTGAANCFNEIIEKDLDRLMTRTADRPLPSERMTTGQALVIGLFMALLGTYLLGKLNLLTGFLSVFSIILYAFVYTPLKRRSPIAVFVGAIPGALPTLIGYVAAHPTIDEIALILFGIQFMWQFTHFYAIAWVLDDDYKLAGFRLLPTGKRDLTSAIVTFATALILLPVSLLPTYMGYGGYYVGGVSLVCSLIFLYQAFNLMRTLEVKAARTLMFGSFLYLPVVQLMFLFDFIGKR
ncbi:heme o synthase [Mucilaginibacter polytrichastri]|uniref:Protoheme IX farnesyltransferase n=1 Tax=Mucilaginibacter polytrichastri TaxID=1302689 RepID=A0A1Q6A6G3_9SPHI|nr:heme o synthase [Mucilaginibacter polytrichastri]OKS89601.1 Protoheme IX farnesyltransferase [Mucilaginibacter polytrichastri]SFS69382.1 protoheme IX farnesyltransferase [Mucilaginibacter polytrichastri]